MQESELSMLTISPQTPVVMVNQPDGEGNSTVRHILPNWVRASPFLPYGRGAMHIKASGHHILHSNETTNIA